MISVILLKIDLFYFTVVKKLIKHFKSLYGFGGALLNIKDACIDFEPCFCFSIHPKSIKGGHMTTLNVMFHEVASFIAGSHMTSLKFKLQNY